MYVEIPPPARLRAYVQCLWINRHDETTRKLIYPDGCTDIIATDTTLHIAGPMTTALAVELAPNTLVTGIRFHPGAASAALGINAATLVDDSPPLGAVWGRAGDDLTRRTTSTDSARDRLKWMTELLADLASEPPDRMSIEVGRALTRRPETMVADMARHLGLSERQLRRRIQESVGYSPRTLARIMRFQQFLAARQRDPDCSLADLAITAGYADQPHLTRECRALTGLTPLGLMSDSFKTQ